MRISVIGLGYVGLPLASLLAESFDVVGFDVDFNKIKALERNEVTIREPGLEEVFRNSRKNGKLTISHDPDSLRDSQVKIITVGTPYDEVKDFVDYSQLDSSLDIIIPRINKGDVIALKSTVPPGTTMERVKGRIEGNGYRIPEDVGIAFAPERIIEGQALKDFKGLPKIIGASDDRTFKIASEVIGSLGGKVIRVSNPETAEMVKMVDNYARFVFLGLTNELALICEKIGVDVLEVIRAAKDDYPRNAGVLHPGPGVGGSCLNKDPFILRGVLKLSGLDLNMVNSAQEVNSFMPIHIAEIVKLFRSNGNVTLLGVAFKGDTDDTRYTPTFKIRNELVKAGFQVKLSDPLAEGHDIIKDMYEACMGVDSIVLLTDHSEYKKIDLERLRKVTASDPLFIDARGIVDRREAVNHGFEYHGLGRL